LFLLSFDLRFRDQISIQMTVFVATEVGLWLVRCLNFWFTVNLVIQVCFCTTEYRIENRGIDAQTTQDYFVLLSFPLSAS
jgi:hypothetical protein